ncbi:MAG: ATP-binding protein [Pseudomonadota bacterium]
MQINGLSSKIYVAFLILTVLPVTIAGLVSVFYSLKVLKDETLLHLDQEVANKADSMAQFVEQLRSDVLYLGNYTAMLDLTEAMANHSDAKMARSRLEQDFAAFARTYPHVYQVRFLDSYGIEIIRVERGERGVKVVLASELQNKSMRYYVHDTFKVNVGEIYISPMDLNVERGKAESPEKPVVRFGTPVADRLGIIQGMVVINLHAEFFLDQLQQIAVARGGTTYLFNLSGFYLARSADSAGLPFEMKPISELSDVFPDTVLQKIMQGNHQTQAVGDWIIAYAPVSQPSVTPQWVVALAYPQRQLFATILNLHIFYGLMALCILVALVAGFYMSRYLLLPLSLLRKETEEIAKGHFAQRVEIKGSDEIADLGKSLNSMAAQLEQLYQCLEQRSCQLEEEVAARTAALEHERQYLAALIENAEDGILSVNSEGYIELANEAAAIYFVLPKDRLIGCHIEECCPQWYYPTNQRLELKIAARSLVLNLTPVPAAGCLVMVRDVSEERQLLDDRRELDRQMFQMEKMATMGELAMGLAHEIGNPLAGMKTVVQVLLEEETLTAYQRKNMHRIHKEIDRLSAFLRTFHGFAAPQEMHPVPCRLEEVLEDVLLWTRKEAKSKGISISCPQSSDNIPTLWADPQQLKQVLLNVVINATHSMENGGQITIRMCICIAETMLDNAHYVRFCVKDTGPGIPPEILPRIFDPFFTTRENGSGLGLAVVKKIVDQHGASIQVDSWLGRGTRFEFTWPIVSRRIHKPNLPLCQKVCSVI